MRKLVEIQELEMNPAAYRLLKKKYGITLNLADAIIGTNDATVDYDNNGKRYDNVMALVTLASLVGDVPDIRALYEGRLTVEQ